MFIRENLTYVAEPLPHREKRTDDEIAAAATAFRDVMATRHTCLLYTSPSPRDVEESRMPSSA